MRIERRDCERLLIYKNAEGGQRVRARFGVIEAEEIHHGWVSSSYE